jgi:acyl-CoA thioesterase
MADSAPPDVHFPLQEFLGFTIEKGEGAAVARLTLDERHMNPHAIANGAVAFALMDTAMGAAAMTAIDEESWSTTIEMQIRYHRPAFSGELRAEANVLSAGKRVIHLEAKTFDAEGRLVASATGGFARIPRPDLG